LLFKTQIIFFVNEQACRREFHMTLLELTKPSTIFCFWENKRGKASLRVEEDTPLAWQDKRQRIVLPFSFIVSSMFTTQGKSSITPVRGPNEESEILHFIPFSHHLTCLARGRRRRRELGVGRKSIIFK